MKKKALTLAWLIVVFVGLSSLVTAPPPGDMAPYLNGVFPTSTPGEGGSWIIENAFPDLNLPSPLRIVPFPDTDDFLVLSKNGLISRVDFETQRVDTVLDHSNTVFHLGEAGAVGIALHPQFRPDEDHEQNLLFFFYRTKPEPGQWSERGYNRLTKFRWSADQGVFLPDSEEILFQQYDRITWHNGGGMFFGKDDFLYLSLGDEGQGEQQVASTQRLDGGLFSGILRIDVDMDPSRSHPIRRQPQALDTPPDGWWDTYSQGYYIPDDNPWQNEDGAYLEEFAAIGLRSPYSTHYDTVTGIIWNLDVGTDKREEFNHVEIGDNLQWPYREGTFVSEVHERPDQPIGNEKLPIFEYDRQVGNAVVMGGVYRNDKFPSLHGQYLHGDFTQHRVMALEYDIDEPTQHVLVPDIRSFGFDLPFRSGINGVHPMPDGEVYVTVNGEDSNEQGHIFRLAQRDVLPDPPARLSELGVFEDLSTLKPIDGIIPYEVNAPLWSDRADKRRWMAVPNQEDDQKIKFDSHAKWEFPEGTVFIKHFDLPMDLSDPTGSLRRLETRFFVLAEGGQAYGLTYKWNEAGDEAFLLRIREEETFTIMEDGVPAYDQVWSYPSRPQCISCHNANVDFVLGVNTHQLNSDLTYVDLGLTMNQLEFLSDEELLDKDVDPVREPRAHALEDISAPLELRIRSYLDANCASCHSEGAIPEIPMDLSFDNPVEFHRTIFEVPASQNSDMNRFLIEPGNHADSELWIRDMSESENKMPPISRNIVHQAWVDSLAVWIDGLEGLFLNDKVWTFPNPTAHSLTVRIGDDWSLPVTVTLHDLSGRLVSVATFDQNEWFMDLSEYSPGVYLLRLSAMDGDQVEVRRIVRS